MNLLLNKIKDNGIRSRFNPSSVRRLREALIVNLRDRGDEPEESIINNINNLMGSSLPGEVVKISKTIFEMKGDLGVWFYETLRRM